ncbi:Hypothetical predicted protein [Paramuricea clavata]|uniref:Uncharacterized protein n=1 Tax=Paramuricea clavata TaxID=317549 RepID=A0A6S7H6G1_PARCT|nr:Hypothetical predicted protein [Paramuricea clavata]
MEKIIDGFEFYFVPKKQICIQVQILKRKITELGDVFSDIQRNTTTHVVYARGARYENKSFEPEPAGVHHICLDWLVEFITKAYSENFVLNQLKSLNNAIGLNNISARLIKDVSVVICKPLTCLYNRSLHSAVFSNIWKMGRVHYRPITVLPTLSKILEKAVHTQVYGILITNKLLTPNQFGFCEKLSTAVALAKFTDTILKNMDDGQLTGVAFLDLSKAFDTVNYSHLLLKLKSIGFSCHVCEWFKSYLIHRANCQVTVVDGDREQCTVRQAKPDAALEKVLGGDFDDDGDVLKGSEIDNKDKNVNKQEKNNLSSKKASGKQKAASTTTHIHAKTHLETSDEEEEEGIVKSTTNDILAELRKQKGLAAF